MKYSVLATVGSPAIRSHHSVGMESCALPFLLMLMLSLFSFNGMALADSTASAYTVLNWASASFSGAVVPAPLPNNTYSTLTEAAGWMGHSPVDPSLKGTSNVAVGWVPANSMVQFGPATFSLASAGTELTAISTTVGTYSVSSQTERSGSILSTSGNIEISIPYTFSIAMANDTTSSCCSTASTQVWIDIWTSSNGLFQPMGGVGIDYVDPFGAVGSYSSDGVLSLSLSGLQPGSYLFDIGAASGVQFVPEPSTLLLLGTGLLGLVGMFLRQRFA